MLRNLNKYGRDELRELESLQRLRASDVELSQGQRQRLAELSSRYEPTLSEFAVERRRFVEGLQNLRFTARGALVAVACIAVCFSIRRQSTRLGYDPFWMLVSGDMGIFVVGAFSILLLLASLGLLAIYRRRLALATVGLAACWWVLASEWLYLIREVL